APDTTSSAGHLESGPPGGPAASAAPASSATATAMAIPFEMRLMTRSLGVVCAVLILGLRHVLGLREGVGAAAPTPSWAAGINRSSGPDGTLRAGGDPESARLARVLGDREVRDADQEDGAGACGRDGRNHGREEGGSD